MSRPRVHGERVATAVRLPVDLYARLHAEAEQRDVSANLLVLRALTEYLDRLAPVDTSPAPVLRPAPRPRPVPRPSTPNVST